MEIFAQIPKDLINFLLVVIFSLLIGLEQRKLHVIEEHEYIFGTDRTITLIGILGFILYITMPANMILFFAGGVVLSALLGIYYYNRIKVKNHWGMTSIITALITYFLTPLVYLQPPWLVMLVVVTILIVVEMKESLFNFSKKFDRNEFTTLAKFIIIAGIILPLLPHNPVSDQISISPYQIWLTIVAVSGISYLSYLLKKFVFPDSGIILSAILGGLYSSTATTVVLAKRSRSESEVSKIISGIFAATGMMYLRILLLAFIFNQKVAIALLPFFIFFGIVSFAVTLFFRNTEDTAELHEGKSSDDHNPLEFKTAFIFAILFGVFAVVTNFVLINYGSVGVNILSFIVGVTDIDPYILNLFQHGGTNLYISTIVNATIIATASNNLIKMIYAIILGRKDIKKRIILGFSVIILVSIVSMLFVH